LGTLTNRPYSFLWTNAPLGSNFIKAVSLANNGSSTTSSPVAVEVVASNTPPSISVSIISPTNGANFFPRTDLLITALASSPDAPIREVSFYANTTNLLGVVSTPPYSVTWSNLPSGYYALTALALNTLGIVQTSAPVSITVSNTAPTVSPVAD